MGSLSVRDLRWEVFPIAGLEPLIAKGELALLRDVDSTSGGSSGRTLPQASGARSFEPKNIIP
jgi:hypothetical protein